jgi:hypothetical protein
MANSLLCAVRNSNDFHAFDLNHAPHFTQYTDNLRKYMYIERSEGNRLIFNQTDVDLNANV